jgi:hypothetical protein
MGHLLCRVSDFQLRMIRLEGILYFFLPGPSLANSDLNSFSLFLGSTSVPPSHNFEFYASYCASDGRADM